MSSSTRSPRYPTSSARFGVGAMMCGALLFCGLLTSCSGDEAAKLLDGGGSASAGDTGLAGDGGLVSDSALHSDSGTSAFPVVVPPESAVCGVDLPFNPPGCSCSGDTAPCWTGPASDRNRGKCHDGVQRCQTAGEFPSWGACEGEEFDCGAPIDPPPAECPCVPGAIVSCDEDCTAFVFCAPFSTKECQPDGTFGPCREGLLPTTGAIPFAGCTNLFHGCLEDSPEGAWSGDCSKAFACGKVPY